MISSKNFREKEFASPKRHVPRVRLLREALKELLEELRL